MRSNEKQLLAVAADAERRSKILKHKSRGTVDEMEILKLILLENRALFMRVMERIKAVKDIAEYQRKNNPKKDIDP